MGNVLADGKAGAIDAVVHMGDHAYNMGNGNDYHGDAYMQAFQAVLARCPWIPVIGNHESTTTATFYLGHFLRVFQRHNHPTCAVPCALRGNHSHIESRLVLATRCCPRFAHFRHDG